MKIIIFIFTVLTRKVYSQYIAETAGAACKDPSTGTTATSCTQAGKCCAGWTDG